MPIDELTILGDMLRAARKEKNFTQQQLADESHISIKEIADIEKGRRKSILPDYENISESSALFSRLSYQAGADTR